MLAAQFLNLLYNIVDRIYISRIPGTGTAALGAVGLCFPVITIIAAFTNLFGSGGAPLFAIARGRGDSREAGMLMDTVFWLELGSAILLMAAGWLFGRPILRLFGASGEKTLEGLQKSGLRSANDIVKAMRSLPADERKKFNGILWKLVDSGRQTLFGGLKADLEMRIGGLGREQAAAEAGAQETGAQEATAQETGTQEAEAQEAGHV